MKLQERKAQLAEEILAGEGAADTSLTRETLLGILGALSSDSKSMQ